MPTFSELGIPFPLYEADVRTASGYAGLGTCALCRRAGMHCFRLYIGDDIIAPCPHCDAENALEVSDRKDVECRACGKNVPFPDLPADEYRGIRVCYDCLRDGKAALPKYTEVGDVVWEHALDGLTMPMPERRATPSQLWISDGPNIVGAAPYAEPADPAFQGLERVFVSREAPIVGAAEEDWYATRVRPEYLFELLRTPAYSTNQDLGWLIHCQCPMIYIGEWQQQDFIAHAPDGDGRALFNRIVPAADDLLWRGGYDCQGIYVFRCSACGELCANWDCA